MACWGAQSSENYPTRWCFLGWKLVILKSKGVLRRIYPSKYNLVVCFMNISLTGCALKWLDLVIVVQVPVYKEPVFTIPGTPGIVQHEILNNRRHVLTKVMRVTFSYAILNVILFKLLSNCLIFHACDLMNQCNFDRMLLLRWSCGRLLEVLLLRIMER